MMSIQEPVCDTCGLPLHVLSGEQKGDAWVNHLGCTNGNYQGAPCPKKGQVQVDTTITYTTL